jgi:hypothetical protein
MAIFLSSIVFLSLSFAVSDLIIAPAKIRANAYSIAFLLAALVIFSDSSVDESELLALVRLLKDGKTDVLLGDWSIGGIVVSLSLVEERGEDIETRGDLLAAAEWSATSIAILVNMNVRKVNDTLWTGTVDNMSRISACLSSRVRRALAFSRADVCASICDHRSDVTMPS